MTSDNIELRVGREYLFDHLNSPDLHNTTLIFQKRDINDYFIFGILDGIYAGRELNISGSDISRLIREKIVEVRYDPSQQKDEEDDI